ncbi:GNAT family N-acetyltransferase [uncultured Limosilactobacillus sp.]|uniref:GNAT family N-acetyltransferase n=1 Tax=uncultured Limosilactobacillus sp. TaxID=2837629 RepID=UPI0025D3DD14|nr:GNAT family N-acetyltransferase [uncultured Limosilactobacillus sp.]
MAEEETEVRIGPAEPADAAALVTFLKQASQESDAVQITNLSKLTAENEVDQLQAIARSNSCEVVVARLGRQVVGVATIMVTPDQPVTGELGLLVGKQFWHQGLGTALLETILDWYRHGSELTSLVLDVFADNKRAIDLYHRYGFVENGLQNYPTDNGRDRQMVHMLYMEKSN